MFDNNNFNEIFLNTQQAVKTRSKKLLENPEKLKEIQEQQEKHQIKLNKLSQLEVDNYYEEDNNDSD